MKSFLESSASGETGLKQGHGAYEDEFTDSDAADALRALELVARGVRQSAERARAPHPSFYDSDC